MMYSNISILSYSMYTSKAGHVEMLFDIVSPKKVISSSIRIIYSLNPLR